MDWNLKIPCWDFTEFEQETIPTIDLTSGSSSLNFSVDLKLGQVIDSRNEFKDSLNLKGSSSTSKMALSPSGSSKRARPINNPIQGANCLVDGCKADLRICKEYHRRHKVCEIHSKTPEVSINGQKQRFCQQCSRFHSLEEFDEGKRSCRKRLDGHNRRRRKPQPDTARAATLFSTHQGTTMIQFSSPHVYQTTTLTSPLWTGMVTSDEEPVYLNRSHKQSPFPESSLGSKKVNREQQQQFSLFHNIPGSHVKLNHKTSQLKVCQQQLLSFRSNNSSTYDSLFCDEYQPPARVVQPVVQSDCALSLLSSSPSQTSCSTPNDVMHPPQSFTATPNPLDLGAGYGGLDSIMDHHVSPDDEAPPTLAFYWE
ncbi:hypothetical protein R6Q57_022720 [Mikania cordata]